MKLKPKILIGVVIFNEADKISFLLEKFKSFNLKFPYKICFLNDGSTDKTLEVIENFLNKYRIKNIEIISHEENMGVGAAIRSVIRFGIKYNFDICVIMAGNGKDDPAEIPKLINPIINDGFDYIQGSRFLMGGSFQNLPIGRKFLVMGFSFVTSLVTGFWCSDSSNGFRAYKLPIFENKKINLDQEWLDSYELEIYIHVKVITLGYKIKEVPVSKNYLPNIKNYSKMRPVFDWWRMSRPLFLLKFGIKS